MKEYTVGLLIKNYFVLRCGANGIRPNTYSIDELIDPNGFSNFRITTNDPSSYRTMQKILSEANGY